MRALLFLVLMSSIANAQDAGNIDANKLIKAIENQRNAALTAHAVTEARMAAMKEELDRALERIKEFEAKEQTK